MHRGTLPPRSEGIWSSAGLANMARLTGAGRGRRVDPRREEGFIVCTARLARLSSPGAEGRSARGICISLLVICLLPAFACDETAAGEITPIPGRPWTATIPDPDTYDWSSNDRPGYRFRGMNEMQRRFHEYIQGKRARKETLSWTERLLIRKMIADRHWPESPRPNEFWAAYMRYLRSLRHDDLNAAQNVMLTELTLRGLVPMDRAPSPGVERLREYLNTGPFAARNWFERHFGRVEEWMIPWLDSQLASQGFPLTAPGSEAKDASKAGKEAERRGAWVLVRREPFSSKIRDTERGKYTVSSHPGGSRQSADTIHHQSLKKGHYEARFSWDQPPWKLVPAQELPYRMSVSVTVTGEPISSSLSAHMYWAWAKWTGDGKWVAGASGGSPNIQKSFCNAATEVSRSRTAAQNSSGSWVVPNGARNQFLWVSATCSGPAGGSGHWVIYEYIAERDEASLQADAEWAHHVDEILSKLGYRETPLGRALKRLRDALAGSDADWKRYVNDELRRLGHDSSPDAVFYKDLGEAVRQGGAAMTAFVTAQTARDQKVRELRKSAESLLAKGAAEEAERVVQELGKIDVRSEALLRSRLGGEGPASAPFDPSNTTWAISTHPEGHAAGYWTFLPGGKFYGAKAKGSKQPAWHGEWRVTRAGVLCTMHYQGADVMFLIVVTPGTHGTRFDVFESDGNGARGKKLRQGRLD